MLQDFKTITKLVERILSDDRRARDDDTYLLFKVWEKQGFIIPNELREKINNYAVSPESVRRIRQKIQEDGRYRGSSYSYRQKEEGKVREWARNTFNQLFTEEVEELK